MKYLFSLISLIVSLNSSAQKTVAAVEFPELNVLYRGYPNIIIPAVTNNDGRTISVSVKNGSVSKGKGNQFIVKPGKGKICGISISLVDHDGRTEVIRSMDYRILNLPDPSLYWGGSKSGQKANIKDPKLFAKYAPTVPLRAVFNILSWSVSYQGETVSGKGSNITSAEELLKKIPSGESLTFEVTLVGPDGISRTRTASWLVDAWDETIKGNLFIID